MANGFTILTSRDNTFFTNNKMTIGSGIPTSGSYKVGDIVISNSQADGIFGWVCTREGSPGNWEVIGSGAGSGGGGVDSVLVEYSNVVEFRDARTSIDIGISEYNKETDSLEVHYNGLLLAEGVHYSINGTGTAITNLNGSWNANADDTQAMIFVVRKSTAGLNIVPIRNVVDINNATMEVEMGISNFNPASDIISVHLNGVLLMQDIDYRIENGKLIKVDRSEAWNPNNVVGQKMYIEVLRNKGSVNEPDIGSIRKEHLTSELAAEINNNTNSINSLTGIANDHTTLINNLTEQVGNVDFSEVEAKIGNLPSLQTTAKGNLVDAVNELFQSANNGKELIANAIGEPLSATDTFTAMREEIEGLLEYFRDKLRSSGVTDSLDNLKLKELIDKVKGPNKYSITKNLTNCTINNDTTIIEENSSYNATITANSKYIMKSITVTMGGADVTNTVVADYNINIKSVTGDIVITANAEANNPYPPGTNVNNTVSGFSAYQYNPVTKSIPVEADGNYTLSFNYGPNISNQGYTATVVVGIYNAEGGKVDSYNRSTKSSESFSRSLTLKAGSSVQITASISTTTNSAHCNQVSGIKLIFNSI